MNLKVPKKNINILSWRHARHQTQRQPLASEQSAGQSSHQQSLYRLRLPIAHRSTCNPKQNGTATGNDQSYWSDKIITLNICISIWVSLRAEQRSNHGTIVSRVNDIYNAPYYAAAHHTMRNWGLFIEGTAAAAWYHPFQLSINCRHREYEEVHLHRPRHLHDTCLTTQRDTFIYTWRLYVLLFNPYFSTAEP